MKQELLRPTTTLGWANTFSTKTKTEKRVGMWNAPAIIAENNFVYKSLSNWSFNIAIGCSHACRFCYVPSAATIKQGAKLREFGVKDPDAEWGEYVLLRPWDEAKFLASLKTAEAMPRNELKRDGNRAIIYCSTTDPYQVFHHPDSKQQKTLAESARKLVRSSLELIRDKSTLNVRILTRSPLARADFDLFKSFGNRLVFGMSLPTLRNDLAKLYEPRAPAPSQRLATLKAAKDFGLHVFVAIAPTYPECDKADLNTTLSAVARLDPITIFHEPINIRAENVSRIKDYAEDLGVKINTEVFSSREAWQDYALESLKCVYELSTELGIAAKLHLWPDKSLGNDNLIKRQQKPEQYLKFLNSCWTRISEWPK
jgi:DNA repair photolyase